MQLNDYRSMPVDPRILDEIAKSPQMSREQGNMMGRWGGVENYKVLASMTEPQRMTLAAVLEGYGSTQEISEVTGFTPWEVNRSLDTLGKQGIIKNYKDIKKDTPYEEPKPVPFVPVPEEPPEILI